MRKYTDKELADYLLEMRQHNGRAPSWRYFKKHRWRFVFFFSIIALLLALGVFAQAWGFCGFVFGLVLGILSRDRAHFQQLQAVWPFYGRVFDWLKVEKIAGGEPSA